MCLEALQVYVSMEIYTSVSVLKPCEHVAVVFPF